MADKEKTILGVTVVSHAMTHVAELTFPATAILVSYEFFGEKEYAAIGQASFISALLFGLAAIPSGWLVDRLGSRRVLLAFLFGTGASLIGLSFMQSFATFTMALALLGIFSGLYHPVGLTMISFGMKEHGKAMGAHGMGGNLGLAITPFLAAALAQALEWRNAYVLIGCLPIAIGLLVLFGAIDVKEARAPDIPANKKEQAQNNSGDIKVWLIVIFFVMAIFNGMAYRGLLTFLPAYFSERVHLDWLPLQEVLTGGTITTAILLLGIAGQLMGGVMADRVRKEVLYTIIFAMACPILFMLSRLENLPLIIAAGVFAILYFSNQPVGNAILPRYASPQLRGRLYGLFFFMSFGVGSIMSWIAGEVGDRYDLSKIFIMLAACLFITTVLGMVLAHKARDLDD